MPRRAKAVEGGFRIEEKPFEQPSLFVTLGEDDPAWVEFPPSIPPVRGAFVKLKPAPGTSDGTLDVVAAGCRSAGALAVRTAPRAKALVIPETEGVCSAGSEALTSRDVVMGMVEEAHTQDRDKLRGLVEEIVAEARL